MKTKLTVLTLLAASLGLAPLAFADSSAFTWQGKLTDAGQPANGLYDLSFVLHDAASGGAALGTNTLPAAAISNGLYTAALDFGDAVFTGDARWLELSLRTNGAAEFTTLTPRQAVTPTPYAIRAANFSGAVTEGQLPANVLAGAAANGAPAANAPNSLVKRDASGNFAAATIAGNLAGNATTATTAGNFTGALAGEVTGTQAATAVATVGGQSALAVASGAIAANAATAANTANALVKRDASGNFAAGAIAASSVSGNGAGITSLDASQLASGTVSDARLSGNVALRGAHNAFTGSNTLSGVTVATNAGNVLVGTFTGNLTGNVTGGLAGNATTATTAGTFTGALAGDVTGTQSATVVASVGGQSAASVASGASAANAATAANTAHALVKRDASGGFSAGAVTAGSFAGDGSALTGLNGANLTSGTVADGRLSGNVALLNGSQSFAGANTFGNGGNTF